MYETCFAIHLCTTQSTAPRIRYSEITRKRKQTPRGHEEWARSVTLLGESLFFVAYFNFPYYKSWVCKFYPLNSTDVYFACELIEKICTKLYHLRVIENSSQSKDYVMVSLIARWPRDIMALPQVYVYAMFILCSHLETFPHWTLYTHTKYRTCPLSYYTISILFTWINIEKFFLRCLKSEHKTQKVGAEQPQRSFILCEVRVTTALLCPDRYCTWPWQGDKPLRITEPRESSITYHTHAHAWYCVTLSRGRRTEK